MSVYVIAEAGVNHNGSLDKALQLVDHAASAGVDAIKFQTFRADLLATQDAPKAEYQRRTTSGEETQYDMLKRLELGPNEHKALAVHCRERGIDFLSSPFDIPSVKFLASGLGLRRLKIPSGEITNAPLLLEAARSGADVILSTGMSTLADIELALAVLSFGYVAEDAKPSLHHFNEVYSSEAGRRALQKRVTLLHCTSEYPAPYADVNLRAIDVLRTAFGLPVGLSDHTEGISVSIAAVVLGATVIEKHFTLDRDLPGPDHKASVEPAELSALVEGIRQVEQALGTPWKRPTQSELGNRVIGRKSLVAKTAIRRGEPFTQDNLTCKRPGHGISPLYYWEWIGRTADRDYAANEVIVS